MSWQQRLKHALSGSKSLTRDQRLANGIAMVLMLCYGIAIGSMGGFYWGTGTMPFGPEAEDIPMPPEGMRMVSSAEVDEFIKGSDTNLEQFHEGFNCVEAAFTASRIAHWEGIMACPIRLDFKDERIGHLLLGIPTTEGWLFYNPEGGDFVKPRAGGMWCDKEIISIYYLAGFNWEPIGEVISEELS